VDRGHRLAALIRFSQRAEPEYAGRWE